MPPSDRRHAWLSSLKLRLLLGAALWVTAALAVGWFVLVSLFEQHITRQYQAELTTHLDQLAAMVRSAPKGGVDLRQPLTDPRFTRPYSGLYWQVDGAAGAVRSRSLWDYRLPMATDALGDGEVHDHPVAGPDGKTLLALERTVTLPDGPMLRLTVAGDRATLAAMSVAFARVLALSLGVLAVGLLSAAAIQVEFGLKPLSRLRTGLLAIREGRARRLEGRFPAEIAPLADELNQLLEHVAALVERARTQAGNLAHGLKTPLAVLANEAARLEDGKVRATIEAQLLSMGEQIDHHLARARAAASAAGLLPGQRTEIGPCLERLARVISRLHGGRGVVLDVDLEEGLAFRGEEQDLQEMAGNLIENAAKWAVSRVRVTACGVVGEVVEIVVEDDGPGLEPDARVAAFSRGVRLDERVPGSGLGLAIVRDLAELYGGSVRLEEAALGGLRAVLRLPAVFFSSS